MEILNIQANEKKDEVIEVIQSMARLRGKHVKIDELIVVRTEDHQLSEAIVSLLGADTVKRVKIETKRLAAPSPSAEGMQPPLGSEAEMELASPGSSRRSCPTSGVPIGSPVRSSGNGHRVRMCQRCGKFKPLAKHKQICEECRNA